MLWIFPAEAIFRRMYHAIIHELIPEDGVVEDMLKGMHQRMVRMAMRGKPRHPEVTGAWPASRRY